MDINKFLEEISSDYSRGSSGMPAYPRSDVDREHLLQVVVEYYGCP